MILLVTFFLTEIVFRCYHYFRPSFVFYDSSYNRFRGKPNDPDYDFHLNSRGFKDVEFNPQRSAGMYRILGLGDSFAYGAVPYQHTYLTLLEENLNKGGRKAEVLNMGIPGLGPRDYLALLVNEGLELKPDMVLVSFFVGNDFVEAGQRPLYTYSYVASFIYYLIVARKGFQGNVIYSAGYDDHAPSFTDTAFLEIESNRSEIYRKQNVAFESDFLAARGYLTEIKRICDERQIKLAVVLIPDEVQVNHTLQSKVVQTKAVDPLNFDFTLPNRLLASKLKQQNIQVIDLLDSFGEAATRTILYKPNDTHWNIAGNKLAGELIASALSPAIP